MFIIQLPRKSSSQSRKQRTTRASPRSLVLTTRSFSFSRKWSMQTTRAIMRPKLLMLWPRKRQDIGTPFLCCFVAPITSYILAARQVLPSSDDNFFLIFWKTSILVIHGSNQQHWSKSSRALYRSRYGSWGRQSLNMHYSKQSSLSWIPLRERTLCGPVDVGRAKKTSSNILLWPIVAVITVKYEDVISFQTTECPSIIHAPPGYALAMGCQ